MARSEARMYFSIWDGLENVPAVGKFVYMTILLDETINHAGIGRLSVALWARNSGLSEEDVERGITALEREPQVVVDRRTQEILVRTMIRRDRVAEQPYVLKAALKEALRTRSPKLRRVLATELRKLPPRPPDGLGATGRAIRYPDPHSVADELDGQEPQGGPRKPLESLSKASEEAPESQSRPIAEPSETLHGGGGGGGSGSTPVATSAKRSKDSPAQQTIKTSEPPEGESSSLPRKRGSRIPDDFAVDEAMVAWAREHAPDVDGRREAERFIDYWQSKSGKDATKLDWVATWRNWMRNAQDRQASRRASQSGDPPGLGTSGKKITKLQALKDDEEPPEEPFLRALPGGA